MFKANTEPDQRTFDEIPWDRSEAEAKVLAGFREGRINVYELRHASGGHWLLEINEVPARVPPRASTP